MKLSRRAELVAVAGVTVLAVSGCFDSDETESGSQSTRGAPRQERVGQQAPNVVMVLTDDQEPDSVRLMPEVLQNVGATGVTFSNAYASVPECCPSRVSLLTGQYAHNHGVISNSPPDGGYSAFGADANTLPVWLHDAGYRTGYVGKYLNGYGFEALGNDPTDIPPGWSYWAALTRHTEYQMYGYTINQNGSLDAYGDRPSDYQTDVLADKAAGFMERSARAGSPFYLTVAPLAPHDEGVLEDLDVPRNPRPAPRHEGRFASRGLPHGPAFDEADVSDKPRFVKSDPRLAEEELADLERLYRSRAESLLAVDDMVRELIATLRREGELDDTLFVFTSDNGYLLGEHRQVGKKKVYEESAGVPLAIRGPGFSGGASVEQPVSNVDLVATIVEMTGVEPGLELDGVSLAPLARGESEARPPVLIEVPTSGGFAAVRTRRFVLAEHEKGATELFDLERDPAQLENVRQVSRYKPARTRLSRKLSELRECAGASCR